PPDAVALPEVDGVLRRRHRAEAVERRLPIDVWDHPRFDAEGGLRGAAERAQHPAGRAADSPLPALRQHHPQDARVAQGLALYGDDGAAPEVGAGEEIPVRGAPVEVVGLPFAPRGAPVEARPRLAPADGGQAQGGLLQLALGDVEPVEEAV